MPELPEVETIAQSLREGGFCGPSIIGRKILNADILWEKSLAYPSVDELLTRIRSQVIRDVTRRGKFIVISLEKGYLLFHLRMSGDLRVEKPQQGNLIQPPRLPHDRAIFYFQVGMQLIFNDPRKFGRIWMVDDKETILGLLGPEPLDPLFSPDDLHKKLQKSRSRIKPLLMNQRFIAGMGNIYADEALFLAGINPLTPASTLSHEQAIRLLDAIRRVLTDGILSNGASIDWVYRGGDFQNRFHVYQRTGKPCDQCGTPIERRIIGQRSSHYCPKCQPLDVVADHDPDN